MNAKQLKSRLTRESARLAIAFLLALTIAALAASAGAALGDIREQALVSRAIAVTCAAATNRVGLAVDSGNCGDSALNRRVPRLPIALGDGPSRSRRRPWCSSPRYATRPLRDAAKGRLLRVRRQRTFFGDDDYATYFNLLKKHCAGAGVSGWAWVLMLNHAHLIVSPSDADGLRSALAPASCSFNTPMICSAENRDRFIHPVPSDGPDSNSPWTKISGAGRFRALSRQHCRETDPYRFPSAPRVAPLCASQRTRRLRRVDILGAHASLKQVAWRVIPLNGARPSA